MNSKTATVTTVDVSHADMQAWIARNLGALTAASCVVVGPGMAQTQRFFPQARLVLGWGVTAAELDTFLRTEIADLPPVGAYGMQLVQGNAEVAARVTWQSTRE